MNLLKGIELGAEKIYEELCYLIMVHGDIESVVVKCENVIDSTFESILNKLDVPTTDENFIVLIKCLVDKLDFNEMIDVLGKVESNKIGMDSSNIG